MPPTTPELKFPTTMGSDAAEYLRAHQIIPISPPCRSSDYRLCLSDPFVYYMARRLGVVPALSHSKALNRGTWMHNRFQHFDLPKGRLNLLMNTLLGNRLEELTDTCKELGIQAEARKSVLEREEKDFSCSMGWYEAASTVSCYEGQSFEDILLSPHWHRLGTEYRLVTSVKTNDRSKPIKCVSQPDLLLYHKGQNSVWILDLKTTAMSPKKRAMGIPLDFQTEHYMFSVNALLQTGDFQKAFNLPSDCRLGGMMHLIIRKPSIEFGMKDRSYTIDTSPFKSGPRKGQPRMEKVYEGEPLLNNYIQRCADWYHATGDYLDKQAEWAEEPPVGISFTSASLVLDEQIQTRYRDRVRLIQRYASDLAPHPQNFPMTDSPFTRADFSTYSPFMLAPVGEWPRLIQQEGFVIRRRDEPIPEEIEFDVIKEPGSEFLGEAGTE